ncbi:MAG TPA: hypothetical protein VJ247_00105, partial [Gaiella sp.]|nr:hypothetical protein [Gaiella sp.]
MCHKCFHNTTRVLAVALAAGVRAGPGADPAKVARYNATMADASKILELIATDIRREDETGGASDSQAYVELFQSFGAERLGESVEFSGYVLAALVRLNETALASLRGMADAGDLAAARWIKDHTDDIVWTTEAAV